MLNDKIVDWAAVAESAVAYTPRDLFSSPGGALRWHRPGIIVLYGNGDLAHKQEAEAELEGMRSYLEDEDIEELGFATARDGCCWALLIRPTNDFHYFVRTPEPKLMHDENVDWAAETELAIAFTSRDLFPSHRGALPWHRPKISFVYGNDDLAGNQRAKDGLADVRSYHAEHGIEELGFATARGGYCWTMLVRSADHVILDDIIWYLKTFRLREARLDVIRATISHSNRCSGN